MHLGSIRTPYFSKSELHAQAATGGPLSGRFSGTSIEVNDLAQRAQNSAPAPERMSSVSSALENLCCELAHQANLLERLYSKLTPVLRSPDQVGNPSIGEPPMACPLAQAIHENAINASNCNRSISELLDLLEI